MRIVEAHLLISSRFYQADVAIFIRYLSCDAQIVQQNSHRRFKSYPREILSVATAEKLDIQISSGFIWKANSTCVFGLYYFPHKEPVSITWHK